MVNLTMRGLGTKMFLEDEHFSETQLEFLADTLFKGVMTAFYAIDFLPGVMMI